MLFVLITAFFSYKTIDDTEESNIYIIKLKEEWNALFLRHKMNGHCTIEEINK